MNEIRYYRDEINDEFSGVTRDTIVIDKNYKYIHNNIFWRMARIIVLRIFVCPFAVLYMKFKFRMRIEGREKLREIKDGYFLFGNHTQMPGDGFLPTVMNNPQRNHYVVSPDNVSLPGTKNLMEMLGAFPLPNKLSGMKNFVAAMKYFIEKKRNIIIYPEAHIWPYYTGIRPFKDDSFVFPYMFDRPSYCFTVTYQKRKHSEKPDMTVYVDGPFWPDKKLNKKQAAKKLRDEIYDTMTMRSKNSNCCYIKYVKKEE